MGPYYDMVPMGFRSSLQACVGRGDVVLRVSLSLLCSGAGRPPFLPVDLMDSCAEMNLISVKLC